MKPFERGTDGEFIERIRQRGLFSDVDANVLVARIAIARYAADEHKLRSLPRDEPRA